ERRESLKRKTCLVSGSGNVSPHAVGNILELGGEPVTASRSPGFMYAEQGFPAGNLEFLKDLKHNRRGRLKEYADKLATAGYHEPSGDSDHNPIWDIKADCAFPCATQNEVNEKDAYNLIKNGVRLLAEGANMATTNEGVIVLIDSG